MFLESERVILDYFAVGDEHLLYDLDSNPNVLKYVGTELSELSDYVDIVAKHIAYYQSGAPGGFFKAILKETNEFIGWFHFRPERTEPIDNQCLELGFRIKEEFWGKGYATEVSKELIQKGFSELGAERVTAITYFENAGSSKVLTNVGLEYVGDMMYMDVYKLFKYELKKPSSNKNDS
ncbi:MAG: GNAT family N-acetyltransferase [Firmicutes bacterium]|nr:GNAT family N-acetyltransferase [Bacillota bacterium]